MCVTSKNRADHGYVAGGDDPFGFPFFRVAALNAYPTPAAEDDQEPYTCSGCLDHITLPELSLVLALVSPSPRLADALLVKPLHAPQMPELQHVYLLSCKLCGRGGGGFSQRLSGT